MTKKTTYAIFGITILCSLNTFTMRYKKKAILLYPNLRKKNNLAKIPTETLKPVIAIPNRRLIDSPRARASRRKFHIKITKDTQMIRLKDGQIAPKEQVDKIYKKMLTMSINHGVGTEKATLKELYKKCHDPSYKLRPHIKDKLRIYGFLAYTPSADLYPRVKKIVSLALQEKYEGICVVYPIEKQERRNLQRKRY